MSVSTTTNNNNGKTVKKEISRFLIQRTFTGKLATVKELKKQQQLKSQQNEESRSD